MKRYVIIFLLISCGCKTIPPKPQNFELSALPSSGLNIGWSHKGPMPASALTWNLGPFIPVAMSLQAMGHEAGSQALLRAASGVSDTNNTEDYEKVVVLCRMLFTFREDVADNHPVLGERAFFGESGMEDWPIEPIEVVDGYPFWIVRGFWVGGYQGSVSNYVTYCITNCDWNAYKYRPLSVEEKRAALAKLLDSKKWKRPLTKMERWVLSSQIE